ncbi:hypothetical protein AAVH_19925 [Aphelenchoides avenae]|nr:hypothetical protein AAVH_19925 [Aphelenchus avenae]
MHFDRTSDDGKYRIWMCASTVGCGATAVSGLCSAQLTLIVPHSHVARGKEIAVLPGTDEASATEPAADVLLSETDALSFLASFEAVASAEGESVSSQTVARDRQTPESGISTLCSADSEQGDSMDNSSEAPEDAHAELEASTPKPEAPPADVTTSSRRRVFKRMYFGDVCCPPPAQISSTTSFQADYRHEVWLLTKYFTRIRGLTYNCKLCESLVKASPRGEDRGSLLGHLREHHEEQYKEFSALRIELSKKAIAEKRRLTSKRANTARASSRPRLLAKYFSHIRGLRYHCELCDKLVRVVNVGENKRSLTSHLKEFHAEQYKEFNHSRGQLVKQSREANKLNASQTVTPPAQTPKSPAECARSKQWRTRRLLAKYFEHICLTHYECKLCEARVTVGKRDDGAKITQAGHLKEHHEQEFKQFVRARAELAKKASELNRSQDSGAEGSPTCRSGVKRRASDSGLPTGPFKMRRSGASVEILTLYVGKRIEKTQMSLEVLVEIFRSLQRCDLDVLQLASRTFSGCVEAHATTFAIRLIKHARIWRDQDECFAHLRRATESPQQDLTEFGIFISSTFRSESPFVKFSGFHPKDLTVRFFDALRWSKVARIEIGPLSLNESFMEAKDAVARSVRVTNLEYKNVAPGNDGIALASLFSAFASINTVDLCASPALFPLVNDSLVTAFGNTKHSSLFLPLCDDDSTECDVSEYAITRYCFTRPLGAKKYRALRVKSPKLSHNFIKKMVEVCFTARHYGADMPLYA